MANLVVKGRVNGPPMTWGSRLTQKLLFYTNFSIEITELIEAPESIKNGSTIVVAADKISLVYFRVGDIVEVVGKFESKKNFIHASKIFNETLQFGVK